MNDREKAIGRFEGPARPGRKWDEEIIADREKREGKIVAALKKIPSCVTNDYLSSSLVFQHLVEN